MDSGGSPPAAGFLTAKTALLGLRLYVVVVAVAAALVVAAAAVSIAVAVVRRLRSSRPLRRRRSMRVDHVSGLSEEEIGAVDRRKEENSKEAGEVVVEIGVDVVGWGRWYALAELEAATGGFGDGNVVGRGGCGTVYRGVLPDCAVVAVKNLHNNNRQAEEEFKVEVEAFGKVRHKNLVGLIGYCAEGSTRMLVYEYVENGNLEQWLHGDIGRFGPLTWEIRMKIAVGTAKGIAYLHEGLEPKVVHRDIKSSNILLDKHWSPKVSDFGFAKLLGSDSSFVMTRVMGTFGYVAPEYVNTGLLNEGSDVYSFGVLLMEIISGRNPVDYKRPAGEVNLVEWFKGMVGRRCLDEVVDPSIKVPPSPRELKRLVMVCLRCVDPEAQKRPKMGHVVHMLEGDEFPFRIEHRSPRSKNSNSCSITGNKVASLAENIGLDAPEMSMWR